MKILRLILVGVMLFSSSAIVAKPNPRDCPCYDDWSLYQDEVHFYCGVATLAVARDAASCSLGIGYSLPDPDCEVEDPVINSLVEDEDLGNCEAAL